MDCTRVEELLALFSGGDLDARQTEAVRAHLVGCPACQAQAVELATSRAWLQAAPPPEFDEAFYADLRQSVLRELPAVKEEGGRYDWLAGFLPQWRWQPVMALAATVLLLFAGWAVYRASSGQPSGVRSPEVVRNPTPTMTTEQKKDFALQQQNVVPPREERSSNRFSAGGRKSSKRRPVAAPTITAPDETNGALIAQANEATAGTASPVLVPAPEMMRMEIQTADPNIRIIWLMPKATAGNPAEPQTK